MKTRLIHNKKCCICGKTVFVSGSIYCLRCKRFAFRLKRLPHKTAKALWDYVRKYGYVCYYTGMALDMFNPQSPWYCVFDHWVPHDQSKIVLTSSLLNAMKADLSEEEFWYFVRQLANFKRWHIKVRKKSLRFWDRDYTIENDVDFIRQACAGNRNGTCYFCGKRLFNNLLKYCPVCAKLAHRLQKESPQLPPKTVENIRYYIRRHGFICYYTKMPLDMVNARSPWYCVFNHWNPADPDSKLVITSALVNAMKSGLSEEDFWYYILQLADYKEKHSKVRKKKLVSWNRLYPVEDS